MACVTHTRQAWPCIGIQGSLSSSLTQMTGKLGQDDVQATLYHNAGMTQLPSVGGLGMMSQQSGASVELLL